jgi:alkyl sulfatase BDS1-like metallo-beta-lactamase superfamily hydrolase
MGKIAARPQLRRIRGGSGTGCVSVLLVLGCARGALAQHTAPHADSKPATPATAQINQAVLQKLPFGDSKDFEEARRGFVGTVEPLVIRAAASTWPT